MNVLAQLGHREGGLIDPWDFQDPAANPPSPCRTIVITDDIRAKDAADRAAREKRPDWKIKAELSEANLGIQRLAPKPKIVQHRTPPKPSGPRLCACGRKLAKDNVRSTCYLCRWHYKCRAERRSRRVKCDTPGCRRLLRFGRSDGLCKTCANKLRHAEVKRRWRARRRAQRSA